MGHDLKPRFASGNYLGLGICEHALDLEFIVDSARERPQQREIQAEMK